MKIEPIIEFSNESERALVALALKYELITGKQARWRKSYKAIYDMVLESMASNDNTLVEKAREFLNSLPSYLRQAFPIDTNDKKSSQSRSSSPPLKSWRGIKHI